MLHDTHCDVAYVLAISPALHHESSAFSTPKLLMLRHHPLQVLLSDCGPQQCFIGSTLALML